jgi:hypothetical protein
MQTAAETWNLVREVHEEGSRLEAFSQNFKGCFDVWKVRMERCVASCVFYVL